MATAAKRKTRSDKLSVQELKRRGTYRLDRHGPDTTKPLRFRKPKPRPKNRCGKKWRQFGMGRNGEPTPNDELAIEQGCYYDEQLANFVVRWFERELQHSKGRWAGEPFRLLPWQRDRIVKPIFGWVRPNGMRRFRQAYIEIPKKNGKSTLASGIGLYMLVGDYEEGAEVYSVAADKDQASIVHGEAMNMAAASEKLSPYLKLNRANRNIYYRARRGFYRAVSSAPAGKEGLNAHCLIVDELHAWRAGARELWDALAYAGRSRTQPLRFAITTAGDDMQSVCREQHEYAQAVLRGDFEDIRFFSFIRAADQDADITDKDVWYDVNPSLGETIDEEEFAADLRAAQRSQATMANFKRYSFNIWNTATNPWLPMGAWHESGEDYTEDDLEGQPCFGGLDLAKVRDMTALVLLFPDEDEVFRQLAYFWMPENTAQDNKHLAPYLEWADAGWLTLTPGNECDYSEIREVIANLPFDLQMLAYDEWNASVLLQDLRENEGLPVTPFRQTITNFAGPTAEYERLVLARNLRHNRNPILSWQAGHTCVRADDNRNLRPVKPKHGDIRTIDGIVAGIMALAVSSTEDAEVYDGLGVY